MKQKLFTKAIENACRKIRPCSQVEMGMDAKVIARFFGGSSFTCYILEPTMAKNLGDFVGLINFGNGFDYAFISRQQLEELRFPPFGRPLKGIFALTH